MPKVYVHVYTYMYLYICTYSLHAHTHTHTPTGHLCLTFRTGGLGSLQEILLEYSLAPLSMIRSVEGTLASGSGTPKTVALETMHVLGMDLEITGR